MHDYNKNDAIFDENWQTLGESETPLIVNDNNADEDTQDKKPKQKKKKKPKSKFVCLITIQLLISFIIIFILFVLKSMDSATYKKFANWYDAMMRNTIVSNETFDSIDLTPYFSSSTDEVNQTADEM